MNEPTNAAAPGPAPSEVTAAAARFLPAGDLPAGEVVGVEALPGGLINDTFRVRVSGGDDFVLQRLNPSVFADPDAVMENIEVVTRHVDAPIIPRLRLTVDGTASVRIADATWRAWELVADAESCVEATPERVASAARLVATFHERLDGLDPGRIVSHLAHFHDPAWQFGHFTETVAADPQGRVADARAEIDAIGHHVDLVALADELRRSHGPAIAHNDTKLANFLFRGDEAVCLLDLDTVMATAPFWDVADLVRSAGHRAAEDDPDEVRHRASPELVTAILDGYRSIRPAGEELERGCVVIAYEQVLRFLSDWLHGDRYWKTTSPVQNLNRARGQLVLLGSLRELFSI